MPNVKVGLHVWFFMVFFHHVRKWWLHVWNFASLGDSMYQNLGGLLAMGMSTVLEPTLVEGPGGSTPQIQGVLWTSTSIKYLEIS